MSVSTLLYLVLIEQAEILPALFEMVFVPQIVRDELQHSEAPESVRRWIAGPPSWGEIAPAGHDSDEPRAFAPGRWRTRCDPARDSNRG
jgi:hypothetical protein